MKNLSLKERYETLVDIYIDHFCKKHDCEFEWWVADRIGEIAYVNGYYIQFDDLRLDIDEKVEKTKIWQHLDYVSDATNTSVNFFNYLKLFP